MATEQLAGTGHLQATFAIPDHVPPELVRPIDFYDDPEMTADPHAAIAKLYEGPRIFWNSYSPRHRIGSWVLTRAEDLRYVLGAPEIFTSKGWLAHQELTGATWPLIPAELDGDEHRKFRALISPWFSPKYVNRITEDMRACVARLVDAVAEDGECEFMEAFARPYPITTFMNVMGLPPEQTPTFVQWEYDLMHTLDVEKRTRAVRSIVNCLQQAADDRKQNPTGDSISQIVASRVDGRGIDAGEIMGILFLLFLGSLDTVVNALGFQFRYLAEHPDLQERLRADPAAIDPAIEELLRRFTNVTARRRATRDVEIAGVQLRAGDWITLPYTLGSLDPQEMGRPMEIDIDRTDRQNMAFAAGPHFCIGAQLARRELKVALEEWFRRVPPFRIKKDAKITVHAGTAFGIDCLPLVWG